MYATPSAAPQPALPVKRSNWGLRLVAALLSALAFLGFWQGAQHTPAAQTSGGATYGPPANGHGGLLPAGGLGPHGATRLS